MLIALMDLADGDPDAETGNDLEDDFVLTDDAIEAGRNPSIDRIDQDAGSYAEWNTLPAATRRAGAINGKSSSLCGCPIHEDDEEDDPSGQCDEDGVNTDLAMLRGGGPGCTISDRDHGIDDQPQDDEGEPPAVLDYGDDQSKGPLPIFPGTDRRLLAPHRDYIRATKCDKMSRPNLYTGQAYVLRRTGTPTI